MVIINTHNHACGIKGNPYHKEDTMNAILKRAGVVVLVVILFLGCTPQDAARENLYPRGSNRIEIFSGPPQRDYKVIDTVSAQVFLSDYASIRDAQNAALGMLRDRTNELSGDGIFDVLLEIRDGEDVISSALLTPSSTLDYKAIETALGSGCVLSPSLHARGKAIRFKGMKEVPNL
jgi:hypothetical protein